MQDTRLQAIAQAICKRQDRYQRNSLLFDQLVQFFFHHYCLGKDAAENRE